MEDFYKYIENTIENYKYHKLKEQTKTNQTLLSDLKGGVNKKFDPSRGHVITMKDSARSDYTKEYQVKRVLENSNYTPNFLKKYHKKYFDYFIYFQNELEKNDNIQNLLVEKEKIFVEFLYTKE